MRAPVLGACGSVSEAQNEGRRDRFCDAPLEAAMHRVVILGAGKIGRTIACLLAAAEEYEVTVADQDESALRFVRQRTPRVRALTLDASDAASLTSILMGQDSV